MKKFIIILMLSLVSFVTVKAQASDTITNISETERLIDKYTQKAAIAIEGLSEAIKVPAKHVYSVLVKQQVIYAWSWVLVSSTGLLFMIFGLLLLYNATYREEFLQITGFMFAVTFGIVFLIGIIGVAVDGLSGFLNPEYGAMMDIVRMFK